MEGRDFLEVAKNLKNSDKEAERRTSVSRSYYAIFNHVRSFLGLKGIRVKGTADAHKLMYYYLNNAGTTYAELASVLDSLRGKRNDADYDLGALGFDKKTCDLHCSLAENFITEFDASDKETLIRKINSYREKTNT